MAPNPGRLCSTQIVRLMWQRTEAQAIFLAMYAPYYGLCNSSGSFAIFAAIRRASVGRQPSCGSIGAVFGSRIKCDHGGRSSFMDRVNNRFKDCKALRGQADTGANY